MYMHGLPLVVIVFKQNKLYIYTCVSEKLVTMIDEKL